MAVAISLNKDSTVNAIQTLFDGQESHMALNNIIMVFPQTDVVQSYEPSLGIQIAARYPMNTALSANSLKQVGSLVRQLLRRARVC